MCGIVALLLAEHDGHANQELFDSLTALQHRGQGQIISIGVVGLAPRLILKTDSLLSLSRRENSNFQPKDLSNVCIRVEQGADGCAHVAVATTACP